MQPTINIQGGPAIVIAAQYLQKEMTYKHSDIYTFCSPLQDLTNHVKICWVSYYIFVTTWNFRYTSLFVINFALKAF